jgi:protein involved in ribonucleotide reduction
MLKSVILRKFLFVVGFFLVTLFFNLVHFVDKLDFTKYSIEEAQSTKISKKLTEFFLYNKDEITPKVQLKKARIYSFKIIKAPLDDPYITVLISMYEGEKNKHYLMNERISYLVNCFSGWII